MRSAGINWIVGDATQPVGDGKKMIAHCCNDIGAWGKGFVLALSRRWPLPERRYREWSRLRFDEGVPFRLGEVQIVEVTEEISVANIIGQRGIKAIGSVKPIRYPAIRAGFEKLRLISDKDSVSFHMPRIGCGLAGGDWATVQEVIERTLVDHGFKVYVYDLK